MRRSVYGAALMSLFVLAFDANAKSTAAGMGVRTCAQFTQDYRKNPSGFDDLYFLWAQGAMSGMNSELSDSRAVDLLPVEFGPAMQKAFIRIYCDQHPLQFYLQAVYALFARLSSLR